MCSMLVVWILKYFCVNFVHKITNKKDNGDIINISLLFASQALIVTSFFSYLLKRGDLESILTQNHSSEWYKWFPHVFGLLSFDFDILPSLHDSICFDLSSLCIVFYSCLWQSADPINDVCVVSVADLETWVFRRLEYSHICGHMYFGVLCY